MGDNYFQQINFDNAATTFPKPMCVKNAAMCALTRYGGNPGRSGHSLSLQTAEAIYKVRANCADFFGAEPENVVFTANCTAALNLAIKGITKKGGHIITSNLEHNSVARPIFAINKNNFTIADITENDKETVDNFESLITPDTKAIVCTAASNVTGQICPYVQIGRLCKKKGICFILDGAQACGILPIKLSDGINFICTPGHKGLYGPTGTGLLISDGQFDLDTIMEGGTGSTSTDLNQPDFLPDKLESGTINTLGIIALGAGLNFVKQNGVNNIFIHEESLCNEFIYRVSKIKGVKIYRNLRCKYVPIVSFNMDGFTSNELAEALNIKGFCLRGGLHCASLAHKTLGTSQDGTVRFAPSIFNSKSQVLSLANVISHLSK